MLVAVAKDGPTAESWQRLLEEADIETQIRTGDAAMAGMPSRASWPAAHTEPMLSLYSYPLYVRDRRTARTLLAHKAGIGSARPDRGAIMGAVTVVALTMLGVIIVVLRS